jgi:hypothetical protein
MKTVYVILFSLDMLALVSLTYLFLHQIDSGARAGLLILIATGIVLTILLLVIFFMGYIRHSSR